MGSILEWFQQIPRNTQTSVQRLGPTEWIRLIAIVIGYLIIRPYLMRLAERKQTAEYEKAANSHPQVTPNVRRGRGGDVGRDDEDEEAKSTASYFSSKKARKRQKQAMGKVVNPNVKGMEDSDDDED
ncbi:MAG: hypothetical protein Q9214_005268, partial [Letrouitia sp. 1 TL-2023]